jgi:hypothetical protein
VQQRQRDRGESCSLMTVRVLQPSLVLVLWSDFLANNLAEKSVTSSGHQGSRLLEDAVRSIAAVIFR